ncbi:MAG: tyrosine-protein phosphatase [Rhodovarius sp.]|nr:tyrosine-protein phosphatase [Rhodovarius sp.]MDW8315970.1 tyrosine-protein phosphatase [Rhodovarius sp.]
MNPWLDALIMDHGALRLFWTNLGTVMPGRAYRSNHPLPMTLRRLVRRHGIRSIVNLRGRDPRMGAYILSSAEARRLGLVQLDLRMGAKTAPPVALIEQLAEELPRLPEPILIHCKSGADRSGLVAAVWLLLQGRPPAEAAAQLSLRHGHIRSSDTGILDLFIARYAEAWPKPFLAWVREDYDPAALQAEFRGRRWANLLTNRILRRE